MGLNTIAALSVGTFAMLVLIFFMMKLYGVKVWKSLPITIILTVTGTISTYIWFLIESAFFGGQSYYGAVFLVPIAFIYVAKFFKISYSDIMDFCAPAECIMLAIMKYRCSVDGCCGGMIIKVAEDGSEILFPSQIAEMINAFVIMALLLGMSFYHKNRGKIYAWYLIIYGTTRFILNLFRDGTTPVLFGLPIGNLWSMLAVFIGILWLKDYTIKIVKRTKKTFDEETDSPLTSE